MKVPEFYLINEKGQSYSLMDVNNNCLFIKVLGLGHSYNSQYEKLGNTFLNVLRKTEQGIINAEAKFKNLNNFYEFVNFIENAEKLKFLYKIPSINNKKREFYKDVEINSISKGSGIEDEEYFIENIVFNCLTLWYEQKTTNYTIEKIEDEIQWDFRWDSRFADYTSRSITIKNDGHVEAELKAEIEGHVINPGIFIYHNGKIYAGSTIPITIEEHEKLLISSRDSETYLLKQNSNKTLTNLFTNEYVDLNARNIWEFKIPRGTSEIELTAQNNITNAKLYIYKYYKVV